MMFDARQKAAEAAEKYPPFEFTGLDGQVYQLPHPLMISERQAELIRADGPGAVLRDAAPEAWAAISDLPTAVGAELASAWMALAGEAGKLLSASSETTGDEPPSKPTSPSEEST